MTIETIETIEPQQVGSRPVLTIGAEPSPRETHEFAVRSARYLAHNGYTRRQIARALVQELPVGPIEAEDAAAEGAIRAREPVRT